MLDRNTNYAIVMLAVVLAISGIVAFLIFPNGNADTIFLTTKSGGVPDTCAPSNGLILAQNLTDLCDVTIISPATNEILQYNGSQWVNVDTSVIPINATIDCNYIGETTESLNWCYIASDTNAVNLKAFGSLSDYIQIGGNSTMNYISTGLQEFANCNMQTGGESLCDTSIQTPLKNLLAGSGILLSSNSTHIMITNTKPESTVCNNLGSSIVGTAGLCDSNDIDLKSLGSGFGIVVDNTTLAGIVYINNTLPENTACSNTGLSLDGSICNGGNISLKGLKESTGIDIVNNTNDITIKTKFANGTGISITGSTTQTFTNTGVTSLTSANSQISLSGSTGAITITPAWKLLCQNTLVANATSISCSSFTGMKQIYIAINYRIQTSTLVAGIQFNGDSGTNYSTRSSANGGADVTGTSLTQCTLRGGGSFSNGDTAYMPLWFSNNSADRKLGGGDIHLGADTSAGTAPTRIEQSCKWSNTSSQITTVTLMRVSGTGSYASGTEITVWGFD